MDTRHAKSRAALAVASVVAVTTLSLFTAGIADASVLSKRRAGAEALKAARPEVFHAHLVRRFGAFLGELTVEGPVFTYPRDSDMSVTG